MNALRTLGKTGAIAVLLLDALKGFAPTLWALVFFRDRLDMEGWPPTAQIIAALVATGAVLGHCFSPWLRFKGGKGVATSFGAIFAMSWPAGLVAAGGWLAGAALTRYSSVGSMLGSALAPFAIWFFTRSLPETLYGVFSAALNPGNAPRKHSSRARRNRRADSPLATARVTSLRRVLPGLSSS